MTKLHDDPYTVAVAKAMAAAPVPVREIARRAGVSNAYLARMALGERRCTARVGAGVAKALESIAAEAATAVRILARASKPRGKP